MITRLRPSCRSSLVMHSAAGPLVAGDGLAEPRRLVTGFSCRVQPLYGFRRGWDVAASTISSMASSVNGSGVDRAEGWEVRVQQGRSRRATTWTASWSGSAAESRANMQARWQELSGQWNGSTPLRSDAAATLLLPRSHRADADDGPEPSLAAVRGRSAPGSPGHFRIGLLSVVKDMEFEPASP